MSCRRYLVSGQVQGVFFRASARDKAQQLGLSGWVKNLPDGRVEAYACGDEEILAKFELWLKQGPPMAQVDSLEIHAASPADCHGFDIR
jgi:acylphosphatase